MKHLNEAQRRPKIALIVDSIDWAFGNIARQLEYNLADRFEFKILSTELIGDVNQLLLSTKEFDLTHFFWRAHLLDIATPEGGQVGENLGLSYCEFERQCLIARRITTSVYDHLFLENLGLAGFRRIFLSKVTAYSVSSRRLDNLYRSIHNFPAPIAILEDGVDLSLFKPFKLERFDTLNGREITIGWAGNSQWASDTEDFKGVRTILEPAIDELKKRGWLVTLQLADRKQEWMAHHEMPQFYNSIDLYVCTSKMEGTPNPILEAMACGVPIISTDVGIVPDLFGKVQKNFIMRDRSIEAVVAAIETILLNATMFRVLSTENLKSIKNWSWKLKADGFSMFFDYALSLPSPILGSDDCPTTTNNASATLSDFRQHKTT